VELVAGTIKSKIFSKLRRKITSKAKPSIDGNVI
jgi:hypothetical protein